MIKCRINNRAITVKEGTKIIEALDNLKIPIPRFCYHNKLSIAANCRTCLVEITNIPKLLPACSTEIKEGMQIFTNSSKVITSQKDIIELLLSNHPLDCPICDQAGECELQDLSLKFGKDSSNYHESKRTVSDPNLGSLIESNMTRCINCTRCIRFGEEIAGAKELALLKVAGSIKVTTIDNLPITSEMSGNMIDLCPVGALTAKPLICGSKPWELRERFGVSTHDCIGSNISYHINYEEEIKRAVAKENNKINYNWLSDRDRFGFLGINNQERLKYPLIKKNNKWYIADWKEALEFVNQNLNKVISQYGGEQLGTLVSPNATLEECHFLQKLVKNLGSSNIDYRLRQIDFREPAGLDYYPYLGINSINDLSKQQFVLLVGSYLNKEQPIGAMHLRQAVLNGCKVVVVNPAEFNLNFNIHEKFIAENADLVMVLLKLTKALLEISDKQIPKELINNFNLFNDLKYQNSHLKVAKSMLAIPGDQISIILGGLSISHPDYSNIVAVCKIISWILDANFGGFSNGANSLGAHLMDCIPQKGSDDLQSLNVAEMLQKTLKAYILFGIEPELDCAYGVNSINILGKSELVIAFTAFESELLMEYADILLPIAVPQESGGTYVNVTGDCQQFNKISTIVGESKPAVKILNKIANDFGWNFSLNEDFIEIVKQKINQLKHNNQVKNIEKHYDYKFYINCLLNNIQNNIINKSRLIRIAPIALYAVDPIVRRSNSLQETLDAKVQVLINPKSASYLNLYDNQVIIIKSYNNKISQFPVKISHNIPEGCILINQVNIKTVVSIPYEQIVIEKATIDNAYV